MPIEINDSGTSTANDPSFDWESLGVGANSVIVVNVGHYGDGNYGIGTPTDWSRAGYQQPGGGAAGVYYRDYRGVALDTTTFVCTGTATCAAWVAIGNVRAFDVAGASAAAGAADPPNNVADFGALTAHDMWIAGVGCRTLNGSHQTSSGYTVIQQSSGNSGTRAAVQYKRGPDTDTDNPSAQITASNYFWAGITIAFQYQQQGGEFGISMSERLADVDDKWRRNLRGLWEPEPLIPDRRPGLVPA